MTLTIYGARRSRTLRVLWLAEELGLAYEHVPVALGQATKHPDFLAINPNGRIPAIRDGDLLMFESLAINLHLARKYGGPMQPATLDDEARASMWSFWAATEIEPAAVKVLMHGLGMFDYAKDPALVAEYMGQLARPLGVLDRHLAGSAYLLGADFTVADLNVAAVAGYIVRGEADLSPWPRVKAWLERCLSRPAYTRATTEPA